MSMQTTGDNDSGEPMLDVNVTPLIDVMLVLLIMFIITIPIQTHAVKLDLPVNQPNQPPPPIDPIKNVLSINGVVLMSIMGSPDALSLVVCIVIEKNSYSVRTPASGGGSVR